MALVKQYDRKTEAKRRADNVVYSDFFRNFNIHPEKHDLARHLNEYAVNEALKNLFLTNKGERFFNPDFGTGVNALLFEPLNPILMDMLNTMIREAISQFEPRVVVDSVQIDGLPDDNSVVITIVYGLVNVKERVVFSTVIERIR